MPSRRHPIAGSRCIRSRCLCQVSAGTTVLVALAALTACDTPGVTLVQADVATSRDSVTFHAQLEDSVLAAALGWQEGVPGVEIQLHRVVDRFLPTTVYTDSAGYARIPSPLPGLYKIAAYRVLSETETGPTGGLVRAFGDGLKQEIWGAASVTLALTGDRQGSLVISEVYDGGETHANQYSWGKFSELYNNSDTTVYLDGMLLGAAYGWSLASVVTCEDNLSWREDPLGIWSREFHQFPGSGMDYAVAPGEAVTIALDAVDHSQVDPTLLNLSRAGFELEGFADTDNPNVPNMPARGPTTDLRGHGMSVHPVTVMFLSLPVDVPSLENRVHTDGKRHVRIPTDRILDVSHGFWESADSDPAPFLPKYQCLNWVNRQLDRLEAVVYPPGDDNRLSMHRKIIRTVAGRQILQNSNTSRLDFVMGLRSPGWIEY